MNETIDQWQLFCTAKLKSASVHRKWTFLIFLLAYCLVSVGQSNVKLSQPLLNFENNRLVIKYDILGVSSTDKFKVELEIRDPEGRKIQARSMYGDIGEDVSGTKGNQIIWDLGADELTMNQRVSVELFATYIEPPQDSEEKINEPPKSTVEQSVSTESRDKTINIRNISMGKALLLSSLVPGLGVSKANPGKPFWIAGVVGYGSLASSYAFYRLYKNSYSKYKESDLRWDLDPNYQKAIDQRRTCVIFLWSGVAIWIADLGYTWLRISKAHNLASGIGLNNLYLANSWDNVNQSQSVSLIYTF